MPTMSSMVLNNKCFVFCKESNLRWRIVVNLAPCSCAGAVEYSRTLRTMLVAKHDLVTRCIHRLQTNNKNCRKTECFAAIFLLAVPPLCFALDCKRGTPNLSDLSDQSDLSDKVPPHNDSTSQRVSRPLSARKPRKFSCQQPRLCIRRCKKKARIVLRAFTEFQQITFSAVCSMSLSA